jgi:hypothetical protein
MVVEFKITYAISAQIKNLKGTTQFLCNLTANWRFEIDSY